MTYTTLLVHVEDQPSPDPRLALAVDLANRFGARLIGLGAGLYRTTYYAAGDLGFATGEMLAAEMGSVEAGLKRAEDKFRSVAGAVRAGSEWRAALQFPLAVVAAEARAADLIVTSRSPRDRHSAYEVAAAGLLVLHAGRPVLVAAPESTELEAARVLVAWKDSREARRALADALPFLKAAESVELVEIVDSKGDKPAAAARLADVATFLHRHGIAASANVDVEDKHATGADQLLEFAEQKKADLIVAGGYGHTRFQEWVFGGFTRALLAQSGRAVLFSH
jgi:nucleotide-binding universal stress UspA family protein